MIIVYLKLTLNSSQGRIFKSRLRTARSSTLYRGKPTTIALDPLAHMPSEETSMTTLFFVSTQRHLTLTLQIHVQVQQVTQIAPHQLLPLPRQLLPPRQRTTDSTDRFSAISWPASAYPENVDVYQPNLLLDGEGFVTGYFLNEVSTAGLSIPTFQMSGDDTEAVSDTVIKSIRYPMQQLRQRL